MPTTCAIDRPYPSDEELIRVAGARWAVEECVQTGGVLSLKDAGEGWRYRS